ncbi:MAG: hypothetical protein JO117_09430 [Verrucomicrobia bacterium]|nr:hypothetical protein [Verrucomicrobiota bacterium]MBV9657327.1 hypothetical protein [Verrucomicrobiota bacterium]
MSPIKPVSPPPASSEPTPSSSVPTSISREELLEMHDKFRAVKHSACNALAVIMALSEMAERNPAYVEKLTKTVLQKSPQMVTELRAFDEEMRALLRALPE